MFLVLLSIVCSIFSMMQGALIMLDAGAFPGADGLVQALAFLAQRAGEGAPSDFVTAIGVLLIVSGVLALSGGISILLRSARWGQLGLLSAVLALLGAVWAVWNTGGAFPFDFAVYLVMHSLAALFAAKLVGAKAPPRAASPQPEGPEPMDGPEPADEAKDVFGPQPEMRLMPKGDPSLFLTGPDIDVPPEAEEATERTEPVTVVRIPAKKAEEQEALLPAQEALRVVSKEKNAPASAGLEPEAAVVLRKPTAGLGVAYIFAAFVVGAVLAASATFYCLSEGIVGSAPMIVEEREEAFPPEVPQAVPSPVVQETPPDDPLDILQPEGEVDCGRMFEMLQAGLARTPFALGALFGEPESFADPAAGVRRFAWPTSDARVRFFADVDRSADRVVASFFVIDTHDGDYLWEWDVVSTLTVGIADVVGRKPDEDRLYSMGYRRWRTDRGPLSIRADDTRVALILSDAARPLDGVRGGLPPAKPAKQANPAPVANDARPAPKSPDADAAPPAGSVAVRDDAPGVGSGDALQRPADREVDSPRGGAPVISSDALSNDAFSPEPPQELIARIVTEPGEVRRDGFDATVTAVLVNCREAPRRDAPVVTQFARGERVHVLDERDTGEAFRWIEVERGGKRGWVYGRYISPDIE